MLLEVNICFAIDNNYAPCLKVALRSLLHNRNKELSYNIVILYSKVTRENQEKILETARGEAGVKVRFVDVTKESSVINREIDGYISIATTYRLLLLSDMFLDYDKILYLDSDIIVEADISKLYFEPMNGSLVAAVEETAFRQLSHSRRAVFIDGKIPYNVDNYRRDALKMKYPDSYFNAGVLLFDLAACRGRVSFDDAVTVFNSKKYFYNDQDVLNILFDGQVCLLDYSWNYQNNVDSFLNKRPELYGPMYADVKRESPNIIHYVSSYKPWKDEVALGEHYHKYEALG